jgi:hypothetical protein
MAIISENHPALTGDQKEYWEDILKNTRILLFELDKAIFALTREEKKPYTMDTGQTNISVTRQDVPALLDRREKLLKQIKDLEEKLGINELPEQPKQFQVVPAW